MGYQRPGLTNGDVLRLTASGLPGVPGGDLTGVSAREYFGMMPGDMASLTAGQVVNLTSWSPTPPFGVSSGRLSLPQGAIYVLAFYPGMVSGYAEFQWYDVTGVAAAIGRYGGMYPWAYDVNTGPGLCGSYSVIAKVDATAAAVDVECRCTLKYSTPTLYADSSSCSVRVYG